MRVKKRIVNQKPFSAYPFEGYPDYTCVWDVAVSPKGDAYVSLCTEGMPAGFNARLFKLPAGGDRLIECVSNREVTCQEPGTSQMPHSKIHTSMQFDEDGRLYYVTYTTSPGRCQAVSARCRQSRGHQHRSAPHGHVQILAVQVKAHTAPAQVESHLDD